jgi:hypothetical protein
MGAWLEKSQTQPVEGKGHEVFIRRCCIGRPDGPGNDRCASAFSVQLRPSRFVGILYDAQRPSRAPPDAGRARARRRQRAVPRRLLEFQRKPSGYMFLAWRCRALALSVSTRPNIFGNDVGQVRPPQQLAPECAILAPVRQILVALADEQNQRLQSVDCIVVTHAIRPYGGRHADRLRAEIILCQPMRATLRVLAKVLRSCSLASRSAP